VPGSDAFEAICRELASANGMDRWTARGTLQLTLMDAGLDASTVKPAQLAIVVERLLPRQLQSNPNLDVAAVCERLRQVLSLLPVAPGDESPDEVFARVSR
jgi:hypothetical protein